MLSDAAEYVADIELDGQVWARVVRSQSSHARIASVDATAALASEHVLTVVTASDLPDVRIPMRIAATETAGRLLQAPLARDFVRYVGEPIAVVVATDPYVAEDAADSVVVDLEELEPTLDARAACEDAAMVIHRHFGRNLVDRMNATYGEPLEDLFALADVVVERQLRIHRHSAVPMETRGLVAKADSASGRLTVWGPTKVKHFNRRALAQMLGLSESAIRFIEPDVGGSFGVRGEFYPEDFLIPWLALRIGRPVAWIEDRAEHFVATNHSREQECSIAVAARRDGELLGFRAKSWVNLGAYVRTQGMILPRLTTRHLAGPYAWRGFEASALGVVTNKTPAGTYRGPGQMEAAFLRERMLDIVAGVLEIDPATLRRRNLVPAERLPLTFEIDEGDPIVYDSGDYVSTWNRLLVEGRYAEVREEVRARRSRGELAGIGLGAFVEESGAMQFEQARVAAMPGGRFSVDVGVASVGQGVSTALSQIAAQALGVDLERVEVDFRDTDAVPEGMGAFASRTTVFGGHAVVGAVQDFIECSRAAAAARFGVPEDRVEMLDDRARSQGEDVEVSLHELGCTGRHRYEREAPSVSMGANMAVVSIDPDTGRVTVESYVVAYDVGQAINPRIVVGQLVGGAAQGLAGAIYEELAYDSSGQPLATSFADYVMPSATEVPEVDVVLIQSAQGDRRCELGLGAKGCGEGGIIGTGAAISNAVADALSSIGTEVVSLPLTPARVFALLNSPTRREG